MSRINTNVASLVAQRVLGQNNQALNTSLERLSTGLAINRGKDNPAGLIASENLRSDITALNAAVNNSERAERVVNIAEGGLNEVSNLLNELQGLVTTTANDAGLSQAEKDANQLQIDSILQTIDRISGSTSFQGTQLLNGNFDFQVSGRDSGITDLQVNGANFNGASLDVDVTVTQSAQQGGLFLSFGTAAIDLGGATSTFVIEVQGSLGTRRFEFSSGISLADAAATINTFADVTGVSAAASAGSGITLASTDFGGDEFVSVNVVDEGGVNASVVTFDTGEFGAIGGAGSTTTTFAAAQSAGNVIRDFGQNAGVTINGVSATVSGKTARIDTDFLSVELTLGTTEAQTLASVGTTAFTITGGGASFQIGSNVDIANRTSIGIGDSSTRNLGSSAAGGFLSDLAGGGIASLNTSSGDADLAQKIVSSAIEQVSSLRGRLGAFQRNTLSSNIQSLGVTIENTAAAQSVIRDADFAAETAALSRNQILAQAATNSLQLANTQPQNALALLG